MKVELKKTTLTQRVLNQIETAGEASILSFSKVLGYCISSKGVRFIVFYNGSSELRKIILFDNIILSEDPEPANSEHEKGAHRFKLSVLRIGFNERIHIFETAEERRNFEVKLNMLKAEAKSEGQFFI